MSTENSQEYSNRMVEAFIGKDEKTVWYQNTFSRYNVNGIDTMQWNWSWWAFFGGFLFLLYRKQYGPAAILFIASAIISAIIPFGWIAASILAGGYAAYFVYKGYKEKLNELESKIEEEVKRIETMAVVGGYHAWVVWIYIVFAILGLVMFISYMSILASLFA